MKRAKNDPLTIVALLTVITLLGVGIVAVTGLPPNLHVLLNRQQAKADKAKLMAQAHDALEFLTDEDVSIADLPDIPLLDGMEWDEVIVDRSISEEPQVIGPGDDSVIWRVNPTDALVDIPQKNAPFLFTPPQLLPMNGPVVEVLTPYVPGSARYVNAPWSEYKVGALDDRVTFQGFTPGISLKELLEHKDGPIFEFDMDEHKPLKE